MEDHRKHHRAPLQLNAWYSVQDSPANKLSSTIINLSIGGFCLTTDKAVEKDTRLKLTIELGEEEEISINVCAVWCSHVEETSKYRIGVTITDETGEDFDRFLNFYCTEIGKMSSDQ